jgi:hypothetical protein
MTTPSRRTLLSCLGGTFVLASLGTPAAAGAPSLSETLLSVVADRRSAAALGQGWLAEKRGDAAPADLADRLAAQLRAQGWSGVNDPAEIRRALDAAARADYRTGQMVTVAGWQMARTQVELSVLAYLATAVTP